MGLFSKKYDYINDDLVFEFDSSKKNYYVCIKKFNYSLGDYDIKVLDEKDLNKRTKRELEEKNEELKTNNELLEYEKYHSKRILRQKRLTAAGIQLNPIITKQSDDPKYYTKNVKNKFDRLLKDDDVVLAIYKVGQIEDEEIKDILMNGLMLSEYSPNAKVTDDYDNLEDKANIYSLNEMALNQLFNKEENADSKGSILIRVPINEYNEDIYYDYNSEKRLRPKYVVGYVPNNSSTNFINMIITKNNVDDWLKGKMNEKEHEKKLIYEDFDEDYYYKNRNYFEKR